MDASKAFDRVNDWMLFKKIIDSRMPPIFVRIIVTWYCEQHACVRWGSMLSPKFNVSNGLQWQWMVNLYKHSILVITQTQIANETQVT